jgi:hypothetical protein
MNCLPPDKGIRATGSIDERRGVSWSSEREQAEEDITHDHGDQTSRARTRERERERELYAMTSGSRFV